MKKILLFLLLLANLAYGQNTQITLATNTNWKQAAYVYLPSDYATSGKNYPVITFLPGLGECQGNPATLLNYGPNKFTGEGWKPDAIIISTQTGLWPAPGFIDIIQEEIFSRYRVDKSQVYITGLSMGGQAANVYAATYPNKVTAVVASHSVTMDENSMAAYAEAGGKWFGIEGTNDLRKMDLIAKVMNAKVKGSAIYSLITKGEGTTHSGWNRFYDPSAKSKATAANPIDWLQGEESIYSWMLKQKKGATTPPIEPPVVIPPARIIAGRVFLAGWEFVLYTDGTTESKK